MIMRTVNSPQYRPRSGYYYTKIVITNLAHIDWLSYHTLSVISVQAEHMMVNTLDNFSFL